MRGVLFSGRTLRPPLQKTDFLQMELDFLGVFHANDFSDLPEPHLFQVILLRELQKLLEPVLIAAGYLKLEFEKPDLQKDVILGFSVQESKGDRSERESIYDLQKLIKKTLEHTNWRLMSDGVTYRLGFLQGRLRGLEGEEKLKELLESEQKKKGLGK